MTNTALEDQIKNKQAELKLLEQEQRVLQKQELHKTEQINVCFDVPEGDFCSKIVGRMTTECRFIGRRNRYEKEHCQIFQPDYGEWLEAKPTKYTSSSGFMIWEKCAKCKEATCKP
jgi:hypothetical protein